jgi:hypothetical protein
VPPGDAEVTPPPSFGPARIATGLAEIPSAVVQHLTQEFHLLLQFVHRRSGINRVGLVGLVGVGLVGGGVVRVGRAAVVPAGLGSRIDRGGGSNRTRLRDRLVDDRPRLRLQLPLSG